MTDNAWNELSSLTDTLERIRRELTRCVGISAQRKRLQADLEELSARRARLIERLCDALPAEIGATQLRKSG